MRAVVGAVALVGAAALTVKASNKTTETRACQPPYDKLAFCDTTLSLDQRVSALIAAIKDQDIAAQLTARHHGGGNPGPESNMTYLGIPTYDWGMNAIHGVQSSCVELPDGDIRCPTSYPNPINIGFTWNASWGAEIGRVIGDETRALWLLGATEADPWSGLPVIGLDAWSPNINIYRDPRWGRNVEVPSESPLINGLYGAGYTTGIQTGEDSRYLKVAVTLKHWAVYSLEDSDGFQRYNFDAIVSNYSLSTVYLPAWRMSVVGANATGVMCSYNAVNGIPTCAHPMLRHILRDVWGFNGYVTSDTGAVDYIWDSVGHHYRNATEEEGACYAIRDGWTDVCSGTTYHDSLMSAVSKGVCSRDDVDRALQHTLGLRMRLGLFDPIDSQPYWHVPPSAINTTDAQAAAMLSTLESMVLLKHTGSALPLAAGKKLAVIGPHANATLALAGNYLGQLCPTRAGKPDTYDCIQSPTQALAAANVGGVTRAEPGCPLTANDTSGFAAATALAADSDAVVLMLGIDGSVEGESHDRTSIDLPYIQHQLVKAVVAAAAGKPVVIVLLNGGSVDVSAEDANPGVGAILEAGYPGVRGAAAIAATLFGANDHLGGKLSYTAYPADYVNQIKMSEMEWDVGVGRGFRFYAGPVVYPFGHGLALTTFSVATASAPTPAQSVLPTGPGGAALTYSFTVTNTGAVPGDEVLQAYFVPVSMPSQPASRLLKDLVDFRRVHLTPGQATTVTFTLTAASFAVADKATGDMVSTPGSFNVLVTNGVDVKLTFPVTLTGQQVVLEPFPGSA